mmetsp:Transcript_10671/g.15619  ORF Transcript_10671/g.15619 Transcript_10671/m.15619 type:complete len:205 (+) Transcript_10671:101-715(+)
MPLDSSSNDVHTSPLHLAPKRIIIRPDTLARFGSMEELIQHANNLSQQASPASDSPDSPESTSAEIDFEELEERQEIKGSICRWIKKISKHYFYMDERAHARPVAMSMFGILLLYSYIKYKSLKQHTDTRKWLLRDVILGTLFVLLKNALGTRIRSNRRNILSLLLFGAGQTGAAKMASRSTRKLSEDFLFATSTFLYAMFFWG